MAGGSTTYSAPTVSSNDSANGVNIVAEGPNNSLKFYWADNGFSTWNRETVAGSSTTYSAVSIANDTKGNSVILAAKGAVGSLDFYYAVNGNSTWNSEQVAGAGSIV